MTKSKYLSAPALRITEQEKRALLLFANFAKDMRPARSRKVKGNGIYQFDMNWESQPMDVKGRCGTAGCILGGADLLALHTYGQSPFINNFYSHNYDYKFSEALRPLFYPGDLRIYQNLTPKEAARAVFNFLETGDIEFKMRKRDYVD